MFRIYQLVTLIDRLQRDRKGICRVRLVTTGLFLCLLFASPVQAQVDTASSENTSFLDRIERQVGKVWSLARTTTARIFGGEFLQVAQVNTSLTEEITLDAITPTLLTTLSQLEEGSLEAIVFNTPVRVSGPFVVTDGITSLGSTTVNGTLTVNDLSLETLQVAQSATLGSLSVLTGAQFGGSVTMNGVVNATGGIITSGADVDLGAGSLFASNVLNSITAGDNVTISGTANQPIISVDDFDGVTSVNGDTGAVEINGRDDIRVSGNTVRNESTLETVRERGGCTDCIEDTDVIDALTVVGGAIDDTVIGATTQAAGYFASLSVGTTTSATGTLRVTNDVVIGNALTVLGTGTTTFSNTINLTDGCFAVNGTCIAGGVVGSYLGLSDTPGSYLAGAIPYATAGADGLTQSSNLVFDGTRLGIGTSTDLSARLSVQSVGTADIFNLFETGGQEVFTVHESGRVGIGDVTPSAMLDVAGDIDISIVGGTAHNRFLSNNSSSDYNTYIETYNSSQNKALNIGLELYTEVSAGATSTGVYGVNSDVLISGTATDVAALSAWAVNSGGEITNLYGLNVLELDAGGSTENRYGVYLSDFSGTPTGDDFGVYQASATQDNYFAGNIGIGTSTPTSRLSVVGTTTLTGNLVVNNATSTFAGSIDITGGCVAYNGTCLQSVNVLDELADVTIAAPGNGDFLQYDGSEWVNVASTSIGLGDGTYSGLSDTPNSFVAGALQYATAGADGLAQSANLTFNGSVLTVNGSVSLADRNALRFYETGSTNYVGFRASSSVASDVVWTLPDADGAANTILVTDGSGNLRFAPVGTVGGGSETYVGLTDTENSFIAGALQFASSSAAALTQSASLRFDGTNFGVGPAAPDSVLTVDGSVRFNSATDATGLSYDPVQNYVGIGTSVPTSLLDVLGGSIRQRGGSSTAVYAPKKVGGRNLPDGANDIDVVGNYVYVATEPSGSNEFYIIDVSDVTNLNEVGAESLPADATSVMVEGDYAYVTTQVTGDDFHIIDVSNPANPTEVGSVNLPTSAYDVTVSGDYAYVVTDNIADEFHVIDMTDRSNPVLMHSIALPDRANAVSISGNYAYVVTNGLADDLHVIDISDTATSSVVTSFELGDGGVDVFVRNNFLYTLSGSTGNDLHIYDISNPASPSSLSALDFTAVAASRIKVIAGFAYITVAGASDALKVIDVSDSANPVEVGSVTITDGDPASVAVVGPYAFVASGDPGDDVLVYEISTVEAQSASIASAAISRLDITDVLINTGPSRFSGSVLVGASGFTSDSPFTIRSSDTSIMKGALAIGTTTASNTLTVAGGIQSTDLLGGATNLTTDVNGNIIRDPSDARLKTNITNIENALDLVLGLQGVRYEWLDTGRFGEQVEIGFIAQEVDLVLPEVVRKGGDYWSLNTRNIVAVVVEAVKELWASLQTTQADVAELQEEVERLRTTVNSLEAGSTTESVYSSVDDDSDSENVSDTEEVQQPEDESVLEGGVGEQSATSTATSTADQIPVVTDETDGAASSSATSSSSSSDGEETLSQEVTEADNQEQSDETDAEPSDLIEESSGNEGGDVTSETGEHEESQVENNGSGTAHDEVE